MSRDSRETEPLLAQNDPIAVLTHQVSSLVNNLALFDKGVKILGTNRDTAQIRDSLRSKHHEISLQIKNLNELFRRAKDQNVDKARYQKLITTFQDLMKQFQQASDDYAKKERTFKPNLSDVQSSVGSVQVSDQVAVGNDDWASLNLKEVDNAQHDNTLVRERNQGIKEVTEDLVTLHEIFADVAKMVGEQGEEIQIVQQQVESADIDTTLALHELRDASGLQIAARKKKLFMIIFCSFFCLVVIVAVILVVYFLLHK